MCVLRKLYLVLWSVWEGTMLLKTMAADSAIEWPLRVGTARNSRKYIEPPVVTIQVGTSEKTFKGFQLCV